MIAPLRLTTSDDIAQLLTAQTLENARTLLQAAKAPLIRTTSPVSAPQPNPTAGITGQRCFVVDGQNRISEEWECASSAPEWRRKLTALFTITEPPYQSGPLNSLMIETNPVTGFWVGLWLWDGDQWQRLNTPVTPAVIDLSGNQTLVFSRRGAHPRQLHAFLRVGGSGARTFTIPLVEDPNSLDSPGRGDWVVVRNTGSDALTVVAASGVTVTHQAGAEAVGEKAAVRLVYVGGNEWDLYVGA